MSPQFLFLIFSSLALSFACGPGSTSNLRQEALLGDTGEEEITAERPTVIAGSHLACSDRSSQGLFKKVYCRISEDIDLSNIDLENLTIRVNDRQIPITINSEGEFEIVVAQEEQIDSDAIIVMEEEEDESGKRSRSKSDNDSENDAAQEEEEQEEEAAAEGNDNPDNNSEDASSENDAMEAANAPAAEDAAELPSAPLSADFPTQSKELKDLDINVISFDKDNKVLESIDDFDGEYKTNTFDFNDKDIDKDYKDILPDLSKLITFRIETHNTSLSKGVVFKINDGLFGDTYLPDPTQLYSTAASGHPEVTTLESLMFIVSPQAAVDQSLHESSEDCVEDNVTGLQGETRDGALTIKIYDENDELYWEMSVYSDNGDCKDYRDKNK